MSRRWYLHPFLFALYPALSLFAFNAAENAVLYGLRVLLASVLIGGAILGLTWLVVREGHRAAFLASLFVLLLLAYGHVYNVAQGAQIGTVVWGTRPVVLAACVAIILLLGNRWVWKPIRNRGPVTLFMNVMALAALAFPVLRIASFLIATTYDAVKLRQEPVDFESVTLPVQTGDQPDIYYIILDGYGREDILREVLGVDTSQFTRFLRSRGFYVAGLAQTNYSQTWLSMASSLNINYLDTLAARLGPRSRNREPLGDLIRHSLVREVLAREGYEIVAIDSGHMYSQVKDADRYLSPFPTSLNEMEGLWLSTSALAAIDDPQALGLLLPSYETHRIRARFAFEALRTAGDAQGPQFVLAHIIAPHPPFVFDAQGNPVDPARPYWPGDGDTYRGSSDEYLKGYTQEIAYVNKTMMTVVDDILRRSDPPPVILIQGDHGSGLHLSFSSLAQTCLRERMPILSAYYLPAEASAGPYPTITPVNSFRVVFNAVFGAGLPLLPDASYYSAWDTLYDFVPAGDRVSQPCTQLVPPSGS
jgi:hypothetical protein